MSVYRRKKNNFLLESLLPEMEGKQDQYPAYKRIFDEDHTRSLSLISALYIYTGTPPHGYGTQAPKVAVTVNRAEEYNRKKERRTKNIGGVEIARLNWEKTDGPFPHDMVHGNYITSFVRGCVENFLIKHCTLVDSAVNQTMQEITMSNSDILTRGRQTFCPFQEQSVTAAQAYENAYNFFEMNGVQDCHSLIGWVKATMECFEKEQLTNMKVIEVPVKETKYDPITKQRTTITKKKLMAKVVTTGNVGETRERMREIVCRFASYIKHKEKGKKDRRAIASGTMFMRAFLHIMEMNSLQLSEHLPGSTISIGGEEKKAKITNNLEECMLSNGIASHICQGTEDATKWNECLSPGIFALLHYYLYNTETRLKLGLPKPSEYAVLFSKLCLVGHLFQAWKEIQLGPGVMVENDTNYSRLEWKREHLQSMNTETKEWFTKLESRLSKCSRFVKASPGMLMGMLNAVSTIVGLLPGNMNSEGNRMRVICMRSSDDSTTKYLADNPEDNKRCVILNKQNLSLAGINLSPDKTFFFPENIGEYTSWYFYSKFVSQYGTEVPSIRPQGKNPSDDLYFIAKSTSTAIQTLTINHMGASIRLRLGISACKRLWRMKDTGTNQRHGVSLEVQLIEDGGKNLWNCVNCHLNEIAMKRRLVTTEEEKDYLNRIMNPDSPFVEEPEEEMTFSKEHGKLIMDVVEAPRNVFTYTKRSNRTFREEKKKAQAEKEKSNAAVLKVIQLLDPTVYLEYPKSSCSLGLPILK